MRIPGLKGLRQSARWLRSRFVAHGALILGYHRVAEVPHDPFAISVTPQHFAEQLEVLRRYTHPIRLEELVQGLQNRNLPRRAVVVTFDDGYADVLHNANPLLERYQIPATVFVSTGYMGGEFWWDELARMILSPITLPARLSLPVNGSIYEWASDETVHIPIKEKTTNCRQRLLLSLYERLLPLSSIERQKAMTKLRDWVGVELDNQPDCRALTADELNELATEGLVDIGAHTVTHPFLAELPISVQQSEIQQSKTCLEELMARPVTSFSYPNGSSSQETMAVVGDSGFVCACTSDNDVVRQGSNRFNLPRFWIPNWDGTSFSRWLQWWLHD
jgi:peptidoglycan/xylan/chitin deacetylase (PgdA/CDA1 family)